MAVADLAPGTIRTRFNNVRSVFRGAHRDRVIGSDPCEAVVLPRRRRPEVAMRIPTPETVGEIMAAAEGWFAPFIGLCAFAGLRLGEAAGVRIDDVDFLRKTLTVSRQVQRAGGPSVDIRAPKYGSERVVYLPDELVVMLSEHIRTVGVRRGRMAVRRLRKQSAAPGCRARVVARDVARGESRRGQAARFASLLRVGVDRGGLRCGDSAAGLGAQLGHHHLEHL